MNDTRKNGLTRAAQLYRRLVDDIIEGRILPGARLEEQGLAERFGVSRTPVREALHQLAASGLVVKRPHRGVVVGPITRQRFDEMFETMAEMEALSTRLAAERMTGAERRALEQQHQASIPFVRDDDLDGYEASNLAFHAAIYAGAHNTFLADVTTGVRNRVAPLRGAQFNVAGRLAHSHEEHTRIVGAIVSGNAAAAYDAMRDHIMTVRAACLAYASNIILDEDGGADKSGYRAAMPNGG